MLDSWRAPNLYFVYHFSASRHGSSHTGIDSTSLCICAWSIRSHASLIRDLKISNCIIIQLIKIRIDPMEPMLNRVWIGISRWSMHHPIPYFSCYSSVFFAVCPWFLFSSYRNIKIKSVLISRLTAEASFNSRPPSRTDKMRVSLQCI